MAKRVYKFTTAKYGITNIRDHRLKLSTIDDLNDPFDLAPLDMTDSDIRRAQEALVVFYRKRMGLLCFSRNWDNLLLWRHYGESHKGICCGFDIADGAPGANHDTAVLYQPKVLHNQAQDAFAEGVAEDRAAAYKRFHIPGLEHPSRHFPELSRTSAREMYAALWDCLNASGAWLENPWVWCLSFKLHQLNIDEFLKTREAAA